MQMFESVEPSMRRKRWSPATWVLLGVTVVTGSLAFVAGHLVFALFWGGISVIPFVLAFAIETARGAGQRVSIPMCLIATVVLACGFIVFMFVLIGTQGAGSGGQALAVGAVGVGGFAVAVFIATWLLREDASIGDTTPPN